MNAQRYFTPDEANKILPLVRAIVRDILEKGNDLRALGTEGRGVSPRFEKAMSEINELVRELEDLGCSYRDIGFQTGMVDFPALINGQEIFLCWQSDEDAVLHYHRHEEGFAGRRSIPPNWYTISRGGTSSLAHRLEISLSAPMDSVETKAKLKQVLVDELMLPHGPDEIADDTPLFGPEGLGLDSVDALQVVVALEKHFGLKVGDAEVAKKVLHSVDSILEALEKEQS